MSDAGRWQVDPGDDALARAAALGDRDAFEIIVRRHGPALYRYAARSVRDPGDAHDVVQEALMSAWTSMARFDGRSSLKTWLFALVSHKVVDRVRRSRPTPVDDATFELLTTPDHENPAARARTSELLTALDEALRQLPYRQRAAWILIEVEGLSQAEAATVMTTTPDAVRGSLARARHNLSERMARWR